MIDYEDADAAEIRRVEDERYAWFMESSVIQLDLPDAVYRGYENDEQLLGAPLFERRAKIFSAGMSAPETY